MGLILFIAFCFLLTLLVINREQKKEAYRMSPSQERAFENIHKWSRGEYDPIIRPDNINRK